MTNATPADGLENLDVAIIGVAGRFPGAKNVAQFWQNLSDGVCAISFFGDDELRSLGVGDDLLRNPNYVKAGGVLEGMELFDAAFFGYPPREAEIMDPQHRLLLECAWEALEDAGHDSAQYPGLIGVFAGAGTNTYLLFNLGSNRALIESIGQDQIRIGNNGDFLAPRVSYKLGLEGPSVTVQTACSTSLVAVHLACQSLLNYQCDMALAGGVTANVLHRRGYLYQKDGILSPDGYCRPFDANAQGTVGGSGVGVVVLKRMADAVADGDTVRAVIKGSAMNNDGAARVGFTAPREDGQAMVITTCLAMAGVEAETIGYVEGHGTATALGDPIEVAALIQAYRRSTEKQGFCALGSVKSNVGHLDAAAGVTGLIKATLALQHKVIPPTLHFESPNPKIDFDASPFYVNTAPVDWKTDQGPRRAGVSSFGLGGTNAHVILEEAPEREPSGPSRPWQLLTLSAKSDSALEAVTDNLVDYLRRNPDQNLADIAYTLHVGRRTLSHRRMIVCRDQEDALQALETRDGVQVLSRTQDQIRRPVAFMFSGVGDQYVNMGWGLYQSEPTFREWIDRCALLLQPHLGLDMRDVLYPNWKRVDEAVEPASQPLASLDSKPDLRRMLRRGGPPADEQSSQLSRTSLLQPIFFVLEYALAQLWLSWGIRPQAMVGYSVGEYVAACVADVLSLEEALRVVAQRAQLIEERVAEGAMLAVLLSEKKMGPFLRDGLSLSGINSPSLCVVGGTAEAIDALGSRLTEEKIACWRLQTSHAFHTAMMTPLVEPLTQLMSSMTLNPPKTRYLSNSTGTWITPGEATDPGYWARHLSLPVRFADAIEKLWETPGQVLLELGPGRSLCSFALQCPGGKHAMERVAQPTLRHAFDQQPDEAFLLRSVGQLWMAGVEVDWRQFHVHERRYRVPLPTYPFERQKYWVQAQSVSRDDAGAKRPERQPDMGDWFYVPSWKRAILPPTDHADGRLKRQWLLFVEASGLGSRLLDGLRDKYPHVTVVRPGERFEKIGPGSYTLCPHDREDYQLLFQDLLASGQVPSDIVHLWSTTADEHSRAEGELLEQAQETGFYNLIFIAHALDRQNVTEPVRLWVVSNGLDNVLGDEVLHPEKVTLLGPCKVMPQEYPNLTCRVLDVVVPPPGSPQQAQLLDQVMAELDAESPDRMIAYRGAFRWVEAFEPFRIAGPEGRPVKLREKGVYLITGGLGKISFVLSQFLAQAVRARLVLLGRSNFPEKSEWAGWMAEHGDQDDVSKKICHVQALEALGAEVLILRADVADEGQMRAAISQALARFGEIHGVLHLAGSVGTKAHRTIPEVGETEYGWHFDPKVRGLYVLERVLQGLEYDFCILASSISAILGGLGFAAYASANAFMDAFAQKHNRSSRVPWTSLDWEGWKFPEDLLQATNGIGTNIRQLAVTPSEGVEVFKRVLAMPTVAQLIVSSGPLSHRIEEWTRGGPSDKTGPAEATSPKLYARPNLSNPYLAPSDDLERQIAEVWQGLLGVEKVGVYDNFFELGGNSLIGLQVIYQLRKRLNFSVPLTILYEGPTISTLAKLVKTYE